MSALWTADVAREDDERTARAVQRLQRLVHAIVADLGGRSESVAGDALFATLDSVVR